MTKITTITASEDDLELIDKGAKITRRSRSNFLVNSAVEKAKEILK